jgi:hypothetical protein
MVFSSKMVCERNSLDTNGAKASSHDAPVKSKGSVSDRKHAVTGKRGKNLLLTTT